jgi:spore germination protein GerM
MFWMRKNLALTCALFLAIALFSGCKDSTQTPPINPPVQPTETTKPPQTNLLESIEPKVYWLRDEAEHLVLVPEATTPTKDAPEVVLTKLFGELLENPPKDGLINTIPENTKLLKAEVNDDGIVIDLSAEFTSGGGGASMIGRLAQVLYTATSFSPDAAVWLKVDGQPLEVLGEEGLEVAQPITRKIFETDFEL